MLRSRILATMLAVGSSVPSQDVSAQCSPARAPTQVQLGGKTLRVRADPWLDLQPGPGLYGDTLADGTVPFRSFMFVTPVPSGSPPPGLSADSIWLRDRTHQWKTALTDRYVPVSDTMFVRRAWGGP